MSRASKAWLDHAEHQDESAGLRDGSKIAVVGAGPSGSMFTYFLLSMAEKVGLDIHVDVYEPRSFCHRGPAGCNQLSLARGSPGQAIFPRTKPRMHMSARATDLHVRYPTSLTTGYAKGHKADSVRDIQEPTQPQRTLADCGASALPRWTRCQAWNG